jgi:general stress protein 26
MANEEKLTTNPEAVLFDELDDVRTGMLGIHGSDQHLQPMTHFGDREAGKIRFITARDTDLAKAVGAGKEARFTVVSNGQDFHACIAGHLSIVDDRKKIEELWSAMIGAWFEGGPEDPNAVLLELDIAEAAMWASTSNPFRFGYQIAKANLDEGSQPDVGEHVVHTFRTAA